MAEPAFPDFELLPADSADFTADEELAALTEDLADPEEIVEPTTVDVVEPLGRTWVFDHETNQVVTYGSMPATVTGVAALIQWCHMALRVERFVWPIFSDEFGRDNPDDGLGYLNDVERQSDLREGIRDALLVHDRITDVKDFTFTEADDGEALEVSATVVVDDETEVELDGVEITRD